MTLYQSIRHHYDDDAFKIHAITRIFCTVYSTLPAARQNLSLCRFTPKDQKTALALYASAPLQHAARTQTITGRIDIGMPPHII